MIRGGLMFKHSFMCNCNSCKCKRRNSGCYL